jgi:hypothetical protein
VFQGRYKAIIVQKESYLLELARYIVLNPVRAGMVHVAEDWPWSSYRATAGLGAEPDWLTTSSVLGAFGQKRAQAIRAYRAFVAAGKSHPAPWSSLKQQIYLGSDDFVDLMQDRVKAGQDLNEIPAAQRRPMPRPLEDYVREYPERDDAITRAYASGGHGLKEIGTYFGLHYSRVSRIVSAQGKAKGKT